MNDKQLTCCYITFVCLVLVGYITYISFSILFLVNDKSLAEDCSGSNLWAYNLVSLILPIISRLCTAKNSTDKDETKGSTSTCLLICSILIEIGLAIWGGIELYDKSNDCNKLKDSNLWNLGLTNFILQILSSSLIIIFIIVLLINTCCKNRNKILQIHPIPEIPEIPQISIEN